MDASLPLAVERLARLLGRLPGVGERSAQRLALHVLAQPVDYAKGLGEALAGLHDEVHFCNECFHLAEEELCRICSNPHRDPQLLCVVEEVADLLAIERSGEFRGLYHVLGGALSPLRGVGPRDLRFAELVARIAAAPPSEVIVATSISVEGEATASYLLGLLRGQTIEVTRIASGVPQGSELEYLDQATLGRAMRARLPLRR
jgi:recombination protein RecR